MKTFTLLFLATCCAVYAHYHAIVPNHARYKREAVGALEIVTNNAQPIHAEVKSDAEVTEKVSPPRDTLYEVKSGRKSWPLTSRLDLIRSITRVVTLAVLVLSAAIEFYPLIQHVAYLYNY